jgi:hypothetical protein
VKDTETTEENARAMERARGRGVEQTPEQAPEQEAMRMLSLENGNKE